MFWYIAHTPASQNAQCVCPHKVICDNNNKVWQTREPTRGTSHNNNGKYNIFIAITITQLKGSQPLSRRENLRRCDLVLATQDYLSVLNIPLNKIIHIGLIYSYICMCESGYVKFAYLGVIFNKIKKSTTKLWW